MRRGNVVANTATTAPRRSARQTRDGGYAFSAPEVMPWMNGRVA